MQSRPQASQNHWPRCQREIRSARSIFQILITSDNNSCSGETGSASLRVNTPKDVYILPDKATLKQWWGNKKNPKWVDNHHWRPQQLGQEDICELGFRELIMTHHRTSRGVYSSLLEEKPGFKILTCSADSVRPIMQRTTKYKAYVIKVLQSNRQGGLARGDEGIQASGRRDAAWISHPPHTELFSFLRSIHVVTVNLLSISINLQTFYKVWTKR